jgi:hypothetical protein
MSEHHIVWKLPCYSSPTARVLIQNSLYLAPPLLWYRPSIFVTVHHMHTCSCITVNSDASVTCSLKLGNEGRIGTHILNGVPYMHIPMYYTNSFSTYILNGVSYMRGHMFVDKKRYTYTQWCFIHTWSYVCTVSCSGPQSFQKDHPPSQPIPTPSTLTMTNNPLPLQFSIKVQRLVLSNGWKLHLCDTSDFTG